MKLPARPRLAEHVLARRHLVGDRASVVLHDTRTGRAVQLGAREWELLAGADGTRDLEGIVLAAAREGAHARPPQLRAFLEQLWQAGFLAAGDEQAAPPTAAAQVDVDGRRALDVLPDFSMHCDGRGSCCRQYETVLFAPVEAARARALCPRVLEGGDKHERAFLPERGAGAQGGSAVALVAGACAYLDAASCRLHEAGGADAKPLGCRLFPATFVDDGVRVRVSAVVECACVLASVGHRDGAPLVPGAARTRGELAPEIDVVVLPPHVRVTATRTVTREALHAWSAEQALAPAPRDVVPALMTLADHVERDGLTPCPPHAPDPRGAPSPSQQARLREHLRALHARLGARAREGAGWRSEKDFARRAIAWMAEGCEATLAEGWEGALAAPDDATREAFYVRASIFGHALVIDDVPLAAALRDRAARVVLARALGRAFAPGPEPTDPAFREPIAVVEAMLRGHGLGAYVHDLDL